MDVGGALAAARSEAGLTVDQVSARTRIRATIVRAIERDDYAICGGDFYARGHIRAIAHVVGADPEQLIKEYDEAHAPPPPAPPAAPEPPRSLMMAAGPGTGATGKSGGNRWTPPGGLTAAEAFRPTMPLRIKGTRRPPVQAVLLAIVALAVVAIVAFVLA